MPNAVQRHTASTTAIDNTEAESEFDKWIADRIRKAGYDVHHQVSCSGYLIDLAVVDPAVSGRYLLGVECEAPPTTGPQQRATATSSVR